MRLRHAVCILLIVVVSAGLFLVGCDSGDSGMDDGDPPPDVSEEVGPDGGTVATDDGRLTLIIPEGALADAETITINAITTSDLGSEFEAVADPLGIENAYELGPDGLTFEQPVTARFTSTQAPVQESDSLKLSAEFLFTADGGSVEALDNLRTAVDTSANAVVVMGQMDHFTPLVNSKANNGVSFFVLDVPESREVDDPFNARAVIQASMAGPTPELVTLKGPAEYADESNMPVEPAFSPGTQEIDSDGEGGFAETFTYSCADPGLGVFGADLAVQVTFNLDSGAISAESFVNFITTIECTESAPEQFVLTVQKDGNGSGTVVSQPAGISCRANCSQAEAAFEAASTVALGAEPADGSVFAGWSGDIGGAAPEDSVLTLTMDQARTVTATFEQGAVPQITLFDATRTGFPLEFETQFEFDYDGDPEEVTAEIDPGDGQEPQEVEFELSTGNTFSGSQTITFGEAGDYTTGLIVVSPDGSDEATIEHQEVTVTIEKDGSGSGTVAGLANNSAQTERFSCGEECTRAFEYNPNAEVYPAYPLTLEAEADENSVFDGWSGAVPPECEGSTEPCTPILMDQSRTVTATFNTAPEVAAAIQRFGATDTGPLEATVDWEVELTSGGNPDNLDLEVAWGDGASTMPELGEQIGSNPQTFEGQSSHEYSLPGAYTPNLTVRYEGAVTAEASVEYVTPAAPLLTTFTGELTDLRTVQFGLALQWAGPLDGIRADFGPTGSGETEPVSLEAGEEANSYIGQVEYEYGSDVQFPVMPTVSVTNDSSGESRSVSGEIQEMTLSVVEEGEGTVTGLAGLGATVINCGADCEHDTIFGADLGFALPVQLTAAPADGYVFADWSGETGGGTDCVPSSEDCIVLTMNQDRTVTATFEAVDQEPRDMVSLVNAPGPLMWLPDGSSFDNTPGDESRLGVVYRGEDIGSTTFDVYNGDLQLRASYEFLGSYSLAGAALAITDDSQIRDGLVVGGTSGAKLFYRLRGSTSDMLESQELVPRFTSNVPDVAVAPGPGETPLISTISFEDGLVQQFGYNPTDGQYVVGSDFTVDTEDANGDDFFDVAIPTPGFAESGNSFAALTSDGSTGSLYTFAAEGSPGDITIVSDRQDNVSGVVGELPVAFECAGWDSNGNSICAITNNDGSGALVEYRLLSNPGFTILEEFTAGVRGVQPDLMRDGDTVMFILPDRTTDSYVIGRVQGGTVDYQRKDAPAECDGPTRGIFGPTTGENTGLLFLGCEESEKLFRMEIDYEIY